MPVYDIRTIDDAHLSQALQLVDDVFMEFEAPEYCTEGIIEFQRFIELDSIKKMLDTRTLLMWGSFDGGIVRGVIAVRPPSHISLMFVDSHAHRQGIARALFEHALAWVSASENRTGMTVNSSPYAVGFYRRMGFVETNIEQTVNGIRFVPMKRSE